jgi:hypothetical protein
MNDTSPEIAAMVHARLMAKTGAERFLMGVRMHEAARHMVIASFPPRISEEQRRQLLFERFYGAELPGIAPRLLAHRQVGKGYYVHEHAFAGKIVDSPFDFAAGGPSK